MFYSSWRGILRDDGGLVGETLHWRWERGAWRGDSHAGRGNLRVEVIDFMGHLIVYL